MNNDNFFNSRVNNIKDIDALEKFRKKIIIKKFIFPMIIFLVFIPLSFYFSIFLSIIFSIPIANIITILDKKKFSVAYKKLIVLKVFEEVFDEINYFPEYGINENVIAKTNMILLGNTYNSNDYISGFYHNISFESADVHIENQRTDKDGNSYSYTIFKGQWYVFDFNKNFKSNFQICEKNFSNNKIGNIFSSKRLHKIELEDIDFNKQFNVYGTDELDVFYVLTPTIIQRIKELNDTVKGALIFCFVDNQLHIGVHNKRDFFEPNILKKVDLERDKQKTRDEVSDITRFIDDLQLEKNIFRKEV